MSQKWQNISAGPRQVKDCKIALAHGTGGTLGTRHSGATLILSNQ